MREGSPIWYYVRALEQYADFEGRATRPEYWWFTLVNVLIMYAFFFVDAMLHLPVIEKISGPFVLLYSLGVALPSFALCARRLRDAGVSAWWFLVILVPLLGPIVLFVLFVLPSKFTDAKTIPKK